MSNVVLETNSSTQSNPDSVFFAVLSSLTSRWIMPGKTPPKPASPLGAAHDSVQLPDSMASRRSARRTPRETPTAGANRRLCLTHDQGSKSHCYATYRRTTERPGRYQIVHRHRGRHSCDGSECQRLQRHRSLRRRKCLELARHPTVILDRLCEQLGPASCPERSSRLKEQRSSP